MTKKLYSSDTCTIETIKRYQSKPTNQSTNLQLNKEEASWTAFDEENAVHEAQRCLVFHSCTSCDLCRYLCPDLCISRNPDSGLIEIDYNYCKGCGICAYICPKGAISMAREE